MVGCELWQRLRLFPFRRWELWEGFDPRKDGIELSSLRRGHGDKGYRRETMQEATWTEAMVAGDRALVEG